MTTNNNVTVEIKAGGKVKVTGDGETSIEDNIDNAVSQIRKPKIYINTEVFILSSATPVMVMEIFKKQRGIKDVYFVSDPNSETIPAEDREAIIDIVKENGADINITTSCMMGSDYSAWMGSLRSKNPKTFNYNYMFN